MSSRNRRTFLKKLGLTIGAVTFGTSPVSAFISYQKQGLRRTPGEAPPAQVDFRHSPATWQSPLCPQADRWKSAMTGSGEYLFPGAKNLPEGGPETVTFRLGGAGQFVDQKFDDPWIPVAKTSLTFDATIADITAFSSDDGDGGRMDHLGMSFIAPAGGASPEIVISSHRQLEIENDEDDDFELGGICFVKMPGASGRILLAVNAPCSAVRQDGQFVLRPASGHAGAPVSYRVTIPLTEQDDGDLKDAFSEWAAIRTSVDSAWKKLTPVISPVSWDLWNQYETFKTTSIRTIEQMRAPRADGQENEDRQSAGTGTNVMDEHFIAEAERYTGRDTEARSRLTRIWDLQNDDGMIVGAGGESDWKQTAVAVYSLCRDAELSGDWKLFDELYPDAFNAMMRFREMRDRAQADGTMNGKLGVLPEGSPGPGWNGMYEEYTNTLWALVSLRALLGVSDRFFLPKKATVREFYGQLRAAFIAAARKGTQTHQDGYTYLPMIHGGKVAGAGTDNVRLQSGQECLAQALYPGLLFLKEDDITKAYLSTMEGIGREDIPVETGPGPDGTYLPESGACLAQVHLWAGSSALARKAFVGFLNHASPVRTWERVQFLTDAGLPSARGGGPGAINVRASAECLRYLRHMLVLEEEKTLRLLDGITEVDLADGKGMSVVNSPTRWGRVTLAHEPLDARAWKTTYRREPVNPGKAPTLASIEMPRRLMPNFQFDKITGTTAIKNGPRVFIDGSVLEWECTWRDFRRY